jgi:hypothetical protein
VGKWKGLGSGQWSVVSDPSGKAGFLMRGEGFWRSGRGILPSGDEFLLYGKEILPSEFEILPPETAILPSGEGFLLYGGAFLLSGNEISGAEYFRTASLLALRNLTIEVSNILRGMRAIPDAKRR